jgi:hypothetical protein
LARPNGSTQEIDVKPDARLRQLTSDLFYSLEAGEWRYAQMRCGQVVACAAASIPSDKVFVQPVANFAATVNQLVEKYFGKHKNDVLDRFSSYVQLTKGTTNEAMACLYRAVRDVLNELHVVPSILVTSLTEIARWLRGEISLAVAAMSAGLRWGLKALALWGARALAVFTGSNFIIASLIIVGAVFLARLIARAVLGF